MHLKKFLDLIALGLVFCSEKNRESTFAFTCAFTLYSGANAYKHFWYRCPKLIQLFRQNVFWTEHDYYSFLNMPHVPFSLSWRKILELVNWKNWEYVLNVKVIEQLLTFFPLLRLVTLISSNYFWKKAH